jgi:hypothetical protein
MAYGELDNGVLDKGVFPLPGDPPTRVFGIPLDILLGGTGPFPATY